MSKIFGLSRFTAAALLAATLALPAAAQQTTTAAAGADTQPAGSLEKFHDALRASKLVGATVYDDQGNSIGKVNDLLVGTDGGTKSIVISVGGFLGIDSKYVEVPFDHLKVEPSRATMTAVAAPDAGLSGAVAPQTTTPAGTATGAATPGATASTAATPVTAPSKQYFSLVLPGATKDSLKSMPDFKYES